ncbi:MULTISPECIES: NUDIX hydrolase [Dermacoccus]|uniref:CoA pyrophosphatase n=2 Tax=Dermacoccus TaxID=57495 RepID=A0A417ZAE1_9MICO|nr:CoA pyrophosphatase [Dermacoccus abyssi]RHW47611.1 CoA pyrophosphatase [Dermacoccus abyssi]
MPREDDLRQRIAQQLSSFEPREATGNPLREAAVCVVIAHRADEPVVLMEKRAPSLRAHAGQFALPGGRIDADETPQEAALRELHEELGIAASADAVLGRLDDFATRSGYLIRPFVVWAGDVLDDVVLNPAEVAVLHEITLPQLDAEPRFVEQRGLGEPVFQWPFEDYWIHAPTAAILHQFREVVLHGRSTRVAHFEQPKFAWK